MHQGVADRRERLGVELRLVADAVHPPTHAASRAVQPRVRAARSGADTLIRVTCTPTAVTMTLIANSAMKVNTTVSLTALPTPAGPPPTEMPL